MRATIAGALLSISIQLTAATIIVDPNPIVTASSITSNVTGADLAGLLVTATYLEPSSSPPFMAPVAFPMTWVATGPATGMASASSPPFLSPVVSVSVTGDASGELAWVYRSSVLSPLISLVLDGTAAGIYFDRAHTGPGTPGAGPGADIVFAVNGGLPGIDDSFVVTYAGAVALDGNPPNNDLYTKLIINFPANFGAIDFEFTQQTDRNIVPEPASWLLVAIGLAAIVTCRAAVRNAANRGMFPVELIRRNARLPTCSSDVVSRLVRFHQNAKPPAPVNS